MAMSPDVMRGGQRQAAVIFKRELPNPGPKDLENGKKVMPLGESLYEVWVPRSSGHLDIGLATVDFFPKGTGVSKALLIKGRSGVEEALVHPARYGVIFKSEGTFELVEPAA